ncbi:hypothetical protein [Micromonospora sp. LH3U1]|uniref:hypothetical protein n=1 Tax=Micromonospora sp. LH3U1 TaxID=3018339 RepID=UPI00234AE191|nr:hypothetical protein [Micromonospora sp. LH3U1]WCN81620.1 hypothetical protein PCA76_00475 [Micromonospora sp. LH3U1]
MSAEPTPARIPLDRRMRAVLTAAMVLAVVVPSFVLRELIESRFGPGPMADVSAVAVPMAATAWLAPYASYRRRDALFWLIGPGIYILAVIAWRMAIAPYRDWRPRPDEVPRMRWSRDPEHAGTWGLTETTGDTRHTPLG